MLRVSSLVMCAVLSGLGWGYGQALPKQTDSKAATKPNIALPRQPRILKVTSTTATSVPAFLTLGPPRPDDAGDLFFRPYGFGVDSDQVAIFKLSLSDESQSKMFKIARGESGADHFIDFAVSASGRLYVLSEDVKDNFHVFSFDSDGDVKSNIKLDTPEHVFAMNLAVFENDTILVTGYYQTDSAGIPRGKSYAALFDSSGKVLRDTSRDFSLKDASSSGAVFRNIQVRGSQDGNLYLLKIDSVLVLSPSGEIIRRIKFVKPDPADEPLGLMISGGLLAVEFGDEPSPGKRVNPKFLVLNSSTGKEYGFYAPPAEVNGMPARFTREDGFVFLKSDDKGKLQLLTAALQ
jgi:hypothetical protein